MRLILLNERAAFNTEPQHHFTSANTLTPVDWRLLGRIGLFRTNTTVLNLVPAGKLRRETWKLSVAHDYAKFLLEYLRDSELPWKLVCLSSRVARSIQKVTGSCYPTKYGELQYVKNSYRPYESYSNYYTRVPTPTNHSLKVWNDVGMLRQIAKRLFSLTPQY